MIASAALEREHTPQQENDDRQHAAPQSSAEPVGAVVAAANKTELRRPKVMRFVMASLTDEERRQRVNGLCGLDPAHDGQWWLDTCDTERQLANWDDEPAP